jgi:hypothetical protein
MPEIFACKAVGSLPNFEMLDMFLLPPVLNPMDENNLEDSVYASKHDSTCADALAQSKIKST